MPKILSSLLLCFSLIFSAFPASATPSVSAQSALVMEASSGRILFQKDAHHPLPMASTTKIMTAVIALEEGSPDDIIKISANAANTEGSSMYLCEGESLSLEEVLYGLMLASGNDAAVAIAEHFGGTENFVRLMNNKAKEIGAKNTHFTNPNGLPDSNHYSTAHDMALITAYALKNSSFSQIVSTKTHTIPPTDRSSARTLTNHNKLLRMDESCIGVKTGFTKAAGRCLVSAAKRNQMTFICVTLNAPDDWNDHTLLYQNLFSQYRQSTLLRSGIPLDSVSVENSEITSLPVTISEDYTYPMAEGETYSTRLILSAPPVAPVPQRNSLRNHRDLFRRYPSGHPFSGHHRRSPCKPHFLPSGA